MNRYLGTIIDIIFVAVFLLLAPYLVEALSSAANTNPNIYIYTTTLIITLHPLACLAILQKIGVEPILQQGLTAFNKGLWRWYSWPLGMLFYYAVFGHSLAVLFLSSTFGEWKRVEPSSIAGALLALAVLFYIGSASVILFRLFKGKKKEMSNKVEDIGKSPSNKISLILIYIILSPFWLPISAAIILIFFSCLYFVVWIFAGIMAKNSARDLALLPDTKLSRSASSVLLFIYTIALAFYFDKITTHIIFNSPLSYKETCLINAYFLMSFYVPFRLFFALYSGKSLLGWATFALSVIITYLSAIS